MLFIISEETVLSREVMFIANTPFAPMMGKTVQDYCEQLKCHGLSVILT